MDLLFTISVVLGFLAMFLSTFPVPHAARVAWGLWLFAAVLWALGRLHGLA